MSLKPSAPAPTPNAPIRKKPRRDIPSQYRVFCVPRKVNIAGALLEKAGENFVAGF
jgi:hypothetical protein